jgi:hypothetical protein
MTGQRRSSSLSDKRRAMQVVTTRQKIASTCETPLQPWTRKNTETEPNLCQTYVSATLNAFSPSYSQVLCENGTEIPKGLQYHPRRNQKPTHSIILSTTKVRWFKLSLKRASPKAFQVGVLTVHPKLRILYNCTI